MKNKKLLSLLLAIIALGISFTELKAQCSANNSWGCNSWYGGWVRNIGIKDAAGGTLASYTGLGCQSSNSTINSGSAIDLVAGQQITIELNTECCHNWSTGVGIWLDQDRNGDFTTSECILDPQSSFYSISNNASSPSRVTLTLPCFTGSGKSFLRFRAQSHYNGYRLYNYQGCGTADFYGSTYDVEVNLKRLPDPVADFGVPTGPNYEKTTIKFPATTQEKANSYSWTFQGPNETPVVNNAPTGRAKWSPASPPSTHDVTLNVSYCGKTSTKTKKVTIVRPTAAPVADFIAKSNSVEIYNNAELIDLSTNGPYIWAWEATSPTGNKYTSSQEEPKFYLDEEGKWSFCLTSENGLGKSTKVCKTQYVTCTPPSEFYMGPQTEGRSVKGLLYDHNGPSSNYGNNRRTSIDYFLINPCDAKEIRLKFKSLRFCDYQDRLRIYDGDQADPAKLLTGPEGINGNTWWNDRTKTYVAKSGKMYLSFESDNNGCTDSGWIATWETDQFKPVQTIASYTTNYDTIAEGVNLAMLNKTLITGTPKWSWRVNGSEESISKDFTRAFNTAGVQRVCLAATNCSTTDTFCKNIRVVTPVSSMNKIDFITDKTRSVPGENVTLTAETNYANNLTWTITPNTYTLVSGSLTGNSSQLLVRFTAGGCYTVELKGYNTALGSGTTRTVTKKDIICAIDYCTPVVDLTNSDVGINMVQLSSKGNNLINRISNSGVSYTNYAATDNATLYYGSTYKVKVGRNTNLNPINYKVWIDYNFDGDFNDSGETVMNSGRINGVIDSASFKVPMHTNAYLGNTRMRVGASYGAMSNTPCGLNVVGEFEDYSVTLTRDNSQPVITLTGLDTMYIEKTVGATACWSEIKKTTYMGDDADQGDLTDSVKVTGTYDCSTPGTYKLTFNLTDASGNKAMTKNRVLIVENDRTAPTIALRGNSVEMVEQCGIFYDSTATAYDITDGNLTDSVKVSGSVNTKNIGDYVLTYTVKDKVGLSATVTRLVKVRDTKAPGIYLGSTRIVDSQIVNVQIGSFFNDYVYASDECNGFTAIQKMPGAKGYVNPMVKGTYPTQYFATDVNGNVSTENGYTVLYKVDDYIAPEISLNTEDTIMHDVKTPYSSVAVTITENYTAQSKLITSKVSNVNANVVGVYTEVYTAEDESGNKATKTRVVKVVDRFAPELLLNSDAYMIHDVNTNYVSRNVSVSDNYSPVSKITVVKTGTVNATVLGTYTETYTATDENGNSTTKVRTVEVVDRVSPQILAPAVNVCIGTPFWAMSGLTITDNYYSASVLAPLVTILGQNINIWEAGVYHVDYSLTDPSGNKAVLVTRPVYVNYPPNCQNTFLNTQDMDLDKAVSISPNPTSGKVTLSYMLQNSKPVSVEVFNVSGSKVASFNNLKSGLGHTEINLAQYGNGVYMIRLSNDGQTTTKRVVVRN